MQEIRLKNEQVEREESSFELQQQAFNKRERQQVWLGTLSVSSFTVVCRDENKKTSGKRCVKFSGGWLKKIPITVHSPNNYRTRFALLVWCRTA
jgi:hypothetical protein